MLIVCRTFSLIESNTISAGAQSFASAAVAAQTGGISAKTLSHEEKILERGLTASFECILQQCSTPLFKVYFTLFTCSLVI